MRLASRIASLLVLIVAAFLIGAGTARAISSTIVISEFRTRGPSGGNDEFIELYNLSAANVNIGGWKVNGSNSLGTVGTRVTIAAGTTLGSGCHYLLANAATGGYSGGVAPQQTYNTGITDDGGIAILDGSSVIVDQVGMSAGSAYKEGGTLLPLTTNVNRSYERKPGGSGGSGIDTDNNASDFQLITPSDPQGLLTCLSVGTRMNTWGTIKILYR